MRRRRRFTTRTEARPVPEKRDQDPAKKPEGGAPRSDPLEEDLKELDSLARQMEDGSLTLDQSVEALERGLLLMRKCRKAYVDMEKTLERLEQGEWRPINPEDTGR